MSPLLHVSFLHFCFKSFPLFFLKNLESPSPPFLLGGIDIQLRFSAIFNLISHDTRYIGVFKKRMSPMCTLSRLMRTHLVSADIPTASYTFEQHWAAFTYNRLSVSFKPSAEEVTRRWMDPSPQVCLSVFHTNFIISSQFDESAVRMENSHTGEPLRLCLTSCPTSV